MSYPNQQGPTKPQPCKFGCGGQIHFNISNPLSQGRYIPLEWVQTPQGVIEQGHNCPARQQQFPQQQQQVAPPAGLAGTQGGPAVKSVTEMLLDAANQQLEVARKNLEVNTKLLNLLMALHPDIDPTPKSEIAAAVQAGLPPEYQPADEIQEPPQ